MKIYSVYDKKAMVYAPVVSFPDEVNALRWFEGLVQDLQSVVGKYPSDFVLVRLADMDDKKGTITPEAMPLQVKEAMSFIIKESAENAEV